MVAPGDLAPFKPAADVTVGERSAALRVHGPRDWETALSFVTPTWRLGAAKPVPSVALDWRLAAGGRVIGDPEGAVDDRNPIGPGMLDEALTRRGRPFRAPQIDAAAAPVAAPFARPEPQGFGPVSPFWLWRRRYAGSYGEAWQRGRAPRLPEDFDYRFFQCAPPALVMPHLRGDEAVRLDGLAPGGGPLRFSLPGTALVTHHAWRDGRAATARLSLDGLHVDLRGAPWRVDLTWRGRIAICPAYAGAMLAKAPAGDAAGLPGSGEGGLVEGAP